jgi:hypothetical protein
VAGSALGPNNELLSNVNLQFPMPDALQEFSVQTSNYSAEYGQNAGGVVNIVTRVGTNGFHGDISIVGGTVRSMPATSLHPQWIKKTLPRMTGPPRGQLQGLHHRRESRPG